MVSNQRNTTYTWDKQNWRNCALSVHELNFKHSLFLAAFVCFIAAVSKRALLARQRPNVVVFITQYCKLQSGGKCEMKRFSLLLICMPRSEYTCCSTWCKAPSLSPELTLSLWSRVGPECHSIQANSASRLLKKNKAIEHYLYSGALCSTYTTIDYLSTCQINQRCNCQPLK